MSKLRLQHIVVQPVFVLDDGAELHAGPAIQPVTLPLSRIADWAAALPDEIVRLQDELDTATTKAAGPAPTS